MNLRLCCQLLALCVLASWIGIAPVRSEDEPAPPEPASLETGALVARWLKAGPARRIQLGLELRRRGAVVLPVIRAARAVADAGGRDRLARLAARIEADWYRQHVPAGMVFVPAGAVEVPRIQRPWGPSGKRAQVDAFYIDRTEVTVAEWRRWRTRLASAPDPDRRLLRQLWKPPAAMAGAMPVVRVRWHEAVRFARDMRDGRLPEAEELERALRGSGIATYPWGAVPRPGCANLRGLGPNAPVPVGRHPEGVSVFGVHDLVGNVAEWTGTFVLEGRQGRRPVVWGGSYLDAPDPALTWRGKERMRARAEPDEAHAWLGFRVVRDVPDLP